MKWASTASQRKLKALWRMALPCDFGVVGTITFTVCHLPLDVTQDGVVNIQDITA